MEEGDYCGCYCLLKGHYTKCYRPTVRSPWSQSTAETLSVCVCVYEFDQKKVLCDIKMCDDARAGGTCLLPKHSLPPSICDASCDQETDKQNEVTVGGVLSLL